MDISGKQFELNKTAENTYTAKNTILLSSDEIFKVVTNPSLAITFADGYKINDTIPWKNVKIVSPTPLEKYIFSKNNLPVFFATASNLAIYIYTVFIILFTVSLVLSILIEIKKQHPYIIVQTLGLIGMLAVLIIL
ncbi:MAG: hypothetical protein AAB348_02340 [Patescibacteria group bacterium]